MNVLKKEKQIMAIAALAEGSSIRSVERMTGVHRDTIMRLGVRVGNACMKMLNDKMRNLEIEDLQVDEIWGYVGKKQANLEEDDSPEFGDAYTFFSIDSQTKLIPNFVVGKRDRATVDLFIDDLAGRLKNRPQISSDGLYAYAQAIERSFGENVDYATIVKTFAERRPRSPFPGCPRSWYELGTVSNMTCKTIQGHPNRNRMSTSYIERQNLTARTFNKRLARLTIAFSKKLENFIASIGLYVAYYNFCKPHRTLKSTPAQAYGFETRRWNAADLVELVRA